MPLIATKAAVLGMAVTTAIGSFVGGFIARDDISQTSELAVQYAEMKVERVFNSMVEEELSKVDSQRFGSENTGL